MQTIKTGNCVASGSVRITPENLENAALYLGQEITLMISCLGSGQAYRPHKSSLFQGLGS